MAKQNILKLALVIVLTMAASSVVHATVVGTTVGGNTFNASMKVSCYYASDGNSGSFDGTNYGIGCGHAQGDKVIGAKSGTSTLYFKTTGSGQGASGASGAVATGQDFTSWTSM